MAQEVQFNKYPLQTLLLKKVIFIAQLQTINFYFLLFARTINPSLYSSVQCPHPPELHPRPDQPRRRAIEPARRLLPATNHRGVLWSQDQSEGSIVVTWSAVLQSQPTWPAWRGPMAARCSPRCSLGSGQTPSLPRKIFRNSQKYLNLGHFWLLNSQPPVSSQNLIRQKMCRHLDCGFLYILYFLLHFTSTKAPTHIILSLVQLSSCLHC